MMRLIHIGMDFCFRSEVLESPPNQTHRDRIVEFLSVLTERDISAMEGRPGDGCSHLFV